MSEIDWASCPEATHFDPVDQNFLRELDSSLLIYNNKLGWKVPIYTQYGVTIEECNRPLIKRPAWQGEGLPPVGTACEHKRVHEWQKVEVFAVKPNYDGSQTALFTYENGCWAGGAEPSLFRPIRTAEQIAAEEREKAIDEMAGWAGVTGLDLDRERLILGRLYDGGYRKQVQP